MLFFAAVVVLTMLAAESLRPLAHLGLEQRPKRSTMPDEADDLPQATVGAATSRPRISVVWLIPILAAVVAIGIAVQRFPQRGADDHHRAHGSPQGVEAGKTVIKYKDVHIGGGDGGEADPRLRQGGRSPPRSPKSASGLMVEDAKFWVVEPRVTLSGVSGLEHAALGQLHRLRGGQVDQDPETASWRLAEPPIITDRPG